MTAITSARPLAVARSWRSETLVFRSATGIALLHALDDAFLNRQPGVPLGQHALAAVIAVVVAVGAAVAFPRLRPGLRAGVALVFGILAVVNGATHLAHVLVDEAARSDLTGLLAVGAGAVLIGLALATPFLHRGEGAATAGSRWAYRAIGVVAGAVVLFFVALPVAFAIVQAHKHREPIGDPPSAAYRPVAFEASDGLEMRGWYVRSKNRAAVIVVHGGGGDRTGAVRHAELLARHGYGVLVYDSRGRGESEGSHNSPGWGWEKDVAGALAYLRNRPDVDRERIGALGLSTGADVLIEVAAQTKDVKAVVSDGSTIRSFGDHLKVAGFDPFAPFSAVSFTALRVLSGSSPDEPLAELVKEVSPTPLLLIAAGKGAQLERNANRVYAEAAREPVEFWDLPDGNPHRRDS